MNTDRTCKITDVIHRYTQYTRYTRIGIQRHAGRRSHIVSIIVYTQRVCVCVCVRVCVYVIVYEKKKMSGLQIIIIIIIIIIRPAPSSYPRRFPSIVEFELYTRRMT